MRYEQGCVLRYQNNTFEMSACRTVKGQLESAHLSSRSPRVTVTNEGLSGVGHQHWSVVNVNVTQAPADVRGQLFLPVAFSVSV